MEYEECKVVSELCCNHQGNMDIAKEMIVQSKLAGADFCKFQKRNIEQHQEWKNKPYINSNSFGKNYYEHRENLEFSFKQHCELKSFCKEAGIGYSCSVWDKISAKEIISLNPEYIKIPSALNNNYELLDYIYSNYNNLVHISVGMTNKEERDKLYVYLKDKKNKTVIYWTTSDYPAKFEELFLLEIKYLFENFEIVGYSAHNLGIAISIVAYVLGCKFIEHHFTLDRTMKGTDHSFSLEPIGMQKICRDLIAVRKALAYKSNDITSGEKINRSKLRGIGY